MLGLNELVLNVGNLVSKGMTASAFKAIEKWVSPVDLQGVVLYIQRTCDNFSTHLLFVSSNLFLSLFTMTWLTVSACPFPWG